MDELQNTTVQKNVNGILRNWQRRMNEMTPLSLAIYEDMRNRVGHVGNIFLWKEKKNVTKENIEEYQILSQILKQQRSEIFGEIFTNCFFLNGKRFLDVNDEDVEQILKKKKDENIEENLVRCVIRWLNNIPSNHESNLMKFLNVLNLEKFSKEFLEKEIKPLGENSLRVSEHLRIALKNDINENEMTLYSLGGWHTKYQNSNTMSMLNMITGKWEESVEMLTAKVGFAGVVVDKQIYACGGWADHGITNRCDVFDTEDKVWKKTGSMKKNRVDAGMAALNGFIYVAGGYWSYGSLMTSVERYCLKDKRWIFVESMHTERDGFALVAFNDHLYAVGGSPDRTVERYDPAINKWEFITKTHHSHKNSDATLHNNKIYVLSENGFEVYDPDLDSWKTLKSPSIGQGTNLVSFNNKLRAIGGGSKNDNREPGKRIFEYDEDEDQWRKLDDMDLVRIWHHTFVVKQSKCETL